jgi:hypothetical protein
MGHGVCFDYEKCAFLDGRRVALVRTDVSKKVIASIIKVEESAS